MKIYGEYSCAAERVVVGWCWEIYCEEIALETTIAILEG